MSDSGQTIREQCPVCGGVHHYRDFCACIERLKAKLADSEASRIKAEAVCADMRSILEASGVFVDTDIGQLTLNALASARRLCGILNITAMLVDHAREVSEAIAEFRAADAKLEGGA